MYEIADTRVLSFSAFLSTGFKAVLGSVGRYAKDDAVSQQHRVGMWHPVNFAASDCLRVRWVYFPVEPARSVKHVLLQQNALPRETCAWRAAVLLSARPSRQDTVFPNY